MVRFNDKTQINTDSISSDDILPITDISDSSDDKKITLSQIKTFTLDDTSIVKTTGAQNIGGAKTFTDGVQFSKGNISLGQYPTLPTGLGSYVASYVSPTYGARLLSYNGVAYQDLNIGSMPTAGIISMKSLANGDCNFGYNVNIAEDLGVTGGITASSFTGNGSSLTDVGTKNITQIGACSTASTTSAKVVTLSGFTLVTGATIQVIFTNTNTTTTPTLNVNSTGAKAIYNEAGTAVSSTSPAYFPAGATIEFTYNGTYWIFKNRVVKGTTSYRIWSDGYKEQNGYVADDVSSITLPIPMITTNYKVMLSFNSSTVSSASWGAVYLSSWDKSTSGFSVYDGGAGWTREYIATGY